MASLLSSCKLKTQILVMRPGDIDLPKDLDSVIVIDRTNLEGKKGNRALSILEGVLSAEPILGDKFGAKATTSQLVKELQNHERLTLVSQDIVELKNDKVFASGKPIAIEELKELCNLHHADGAIVLEMFDSDYYYQGTTQVTTYWRIYYKDSAQIIDENYIYSSMGSGASVDWRLPTNYGAIRRAGEQTAKLYLNRIAPHYMNEHRIIYKGSREMRRAKRAVKRNDWPEAIYLWEVTYETSSIKKMRKAAYNLAVGNENEKDFKKALEWVNIAQELGSKKAEKLKKIIQLRIDEQPLIEMQMKRS